jgi:hypothetical protein
MVISEFWFPNSKIKRKTQIPKFEVEKKLRVWRPKFHDYHLFQILLLLLLILIMNRNLPSGSCNSIPPLQ